MCRLVVIFGRNSSRSTGEWYGLKARTQVVVHEIEKRCEVGGSDFTGLGLAAIGDTFKKRLDKINGEYLQAPVAMFRQKGVITDS
jgi:hypothetical protein